MRNTAHIITMRIARTLLWFSNRVFDIKLFFLAIKHGGRKNIPISAYGLAKSGGMDDLIKTMKITAAVQDISKKFELDFMTFDFTGVVGMFIRGELEDKELFDDIMKLREMDKVKVRREVFNRLMKHGDITQRKFEFMYTGEHRAKFEEWLDYHPASDQTE